MYVSKSFASIEASNFSVRLSTCAWTLHIDADAEATAAEEVVTVDVYLKPITEDLSIADLEVQR